MQRHLQCVHVQHVYHLQSRGQSPISYLHNSFLDRHGHTEIDNIVCPSLSRPTLCMYMIYVLVSSRPNPVDINNINVSIHNGNW